MERRTSRGRQRIAIEKIENEDSRYATFSKRRRGLLKKASELCTLCDTDIGIIIFSPTGKPFSFFHPTMETVIDRYHNRQQPENDANSIYEKYVRGQINQLNEKLDEIYQQVEVEKKRAKRLNEIEENRTVKGWWEAPVEELNKEQVQQLKSFLLNVKNQVGERIKELSASSSSMVPPEKSSPNTYVPGLFPNPDPNAGGSSSGTGNTGESSSTPVVPSGGSFQNTYVNPGFLPIYAGGSSSGAGNTGDSSFEPVVRNTYVNPGFLPNAGGSSGGHGRSYFSGPVVPQGGMLPNPYYLGFFPDPNAGAFSSGTGNMGGSSFSAPMVPQGGSLPNPYNFPSFFYPSPNTGAFSSGTESMGASSSASVVPFPYGPGPYPYDPNAGASGSGSRQGN